MDGTRPRAGRVGESVQGSNRVAKCQRRYSESDKARALAALDANGGNVKRTAGQVGVPASTLTEWAAGRVHPDVTTSRDEKKKDLAAELERLALALVDHCGKAETIAGASLIQAATSLGIAVDKLQNLRGQNAGDGRTHPFIFMPDNGRGPAGGADPPAGAADGVPG